MQNMTADQGSTEPLRSWELPNVGTRPAGSLPPLHAFEYYSCAKMPAPCRPSIGRQGQGAQPTRDLRGLSSLLQMSASHAYDCMQF